jgi:hypothetical protein
LASINITDQLALNIAAELSPFSSWLKYASDLFPRRRRKGPRAEILIISPHFVFDGEVLKDANVRSQAIG